eukprot:CAMPEP_0175469934 /NCGR_PEP_ID=MMETSP0095-20121207/72592_1 /TAXON_ID=311494 /ORGANISM="Alexandrium monilatum, Strain CCMP3105" /LENGTH=159 /DNA_ID=CAMNT_0016771355 /DNA_START=32 /DNA_END=508 /DNA_ORIENTATION=+
MVDQMLEEVETEEPPLHVLVRSVAGQPLTELSMPQGSLAFELQHRLAGELGISAYTQRLMIAGTSNSAILTWESPLPPLPQPLDLTLVVMSINSENGPELLRFSEQGNLQHVRRAIYSATDPDFQDEMGRTAIWLASARGHLDVIEFLLEVKADADKAK